MEKNNFNQKYYYDIEINKAKFNEAAKKNIKFNNEHIGSSFDIFLKEFNIQFKRDINWAIKMLQQGVIVYREEFPEVILFPIGYKNNSETKLTVDDLFAEDWRIFRGKSLKEVLDDFDAGKSIRRKSWYPEYLVGKYSKDIELTMQDLKARDWEVVDVVDEVNQIQESILKAQAKKGN
jgi:hypothetical protein